MKIELASGKQKNVEYIGSAMDEVLYIIAHGDLKAAASTYSDKKETAIIKVPYPDGTNKIFEGFTEIENIVSTGQNLWRISLRRQENES